LRRESVRVSSTASDFSVVIRFATSFCTNLRFLRAGRLEGGPANVPLVEEALGDDVVANEALGTRPRFSLVSLRGRPGVRRRLCFGMVVFKYVMRHYISSGENLRYVADTSPKSVLATHNFFT